MKDTILKPLGFAITIVTFFIVYLPIIIIIFLSVNESVNNYEFTGFSLKWYGEIVKEDDLLRAIINTLMIAIISTIFATIIGTFVAIGIDSLNKKQRIKIMLVNNIPIINPDIVTGISLMIIFIILPISFGMQTMLLAHIFFSIPFVVLTVLPKLKEVDSNLYDAARDLGCTRFEAIIKVIIPAIKSGIIAGALIAFTMSIDDFIISYFTTGGDFQNVSLWIYAKLGRRNFSPAVYAYNSLIVLITASLLIIVNRKVSKKEKLN